MVDTSYFKLFLSELLISDKFGINSNTNIFHYTTVDTLLKILQKDTIKFWFSKYDCLNDLSEGIEVIKSYIDACNYCLNVNKSIDNDFFNAILNIKPSEQFIFDKNICYKNAYICCFSADRNSLDLWRYYPKTLNCGCNLGLNAGIFNEKLKDCKNFNLQSVLYDETDKINYWIKKIEKVYKYYIESKNLDTSINFLSWILGKTRFLFKHKCFKSENERRAIMYLPEGKLDTVKYRTNNGIVIPYIEVEIDVSCLINIMFAPLAKQKELTKSTLKDYLNVNGYSEKIQIDFSELPMRF